MDSIFPLRTTPFEEYLIADDRPGYRMTFLVDHSFEGEIDREAFETGINEALARHPLLNAILERSGSRRWWVPQQGVRPHLDWNHIDEPVRFPDDLKMDLHRETGLRLYVRVGRGQSRFVAEFHHACCDGFGATQFITDLFAGYVRRMMPDAAWLPEYRPIDPRQLLRRHAITANWETFREWCSITSHLIHAVSDLAWTPPVPLAPPIVENSSTPLEFPATIARTLDPGIHAGLRKLARQHDVTVHELLVRELLMTVRDWNDRRGVGMANDRLSILVPANLRTRAHDQLPAANLIGYMSFYRNASECDAPARLLDYIRAESSFMKRTRFASTIMTILSVGNFIPGFMNYALTRSNCFATAVLSAMGDLSRAIAARYPVNSAGNPIAANLVLTDINSAPPIRQLTRASFITWNVCNVQRLGVRCDPTVFSQQGAQSLLDVFNDRIVELTAAVTEKPSIHRTAIRRSA